MREDKGSNSAETVRLRRPRRVEFAKSIVFLYDMDLCTYCHERIGEPFHVDILGTSGKEVYEADDVRIG